MTQPGELHTQAFYLRADEDFAAAIDASDVALDQVIEAKSRVLDLRERVKDMEAECLINGGQGIYTFGPQDNEKKRDAKLRLSLKEWDSYQSLRKELGEAERELDRAEARRDTAGNRINHARRRIDAYLAASNQRAAVLTVTQEAARPRGRN